MLTEYALIGRTLGHSFSAKFFNEKFEAENISARYINLPLPDINALPSALKEHPALRGFNVTIPYKEAILPYLHTLTEQARMAGAVNTVRIERTGTEVLLHGHNTDIEGVAGSLRPMLSTSAPKPVALILGTGGASRAVAVALKQLGIEFTLVSRSKKEGVITYEQIDAECMATHRLIINATPLGTYPQTEEKPPLPYKYVTGEHLAFDLVYNPPLTAFLKAAMEQGALCRNGLTMLHLQALAAWEFWQKGD